MNILPTVNAVLGDSSPVPEVLLPYFETNQGLGPIVQGIAGLNSPITDGTYVNIFRIGRYYFASEEDRKPKQDMGPFNYQRKDTGDMFYHYLFKQFGIKGDLIDPAMGIENERIVK
jgi:hypothetical protein